MRHARVAPSNSVSRAAHTVWLRQASCHLGFPTGHCTMKVQSCSTSRYQRVFIVLSWPRPTCFGSPYSNCLRGHQSPICHVGTAWYNSLDNPPQGFWQQLKCQLSVNTLQVSLDYFCQGMMASERLSGLNAPCACYPVT